MYARPVPCDSTHARPDGHARLAEKPANDLRIAYTELVAQLGQEHGSPGAGDRPQRRGDVRHRARRLVVLVTAGPQGAGALPAEAAEDTDDDVHDLGQRGDDPPHGERPDHGKRDEGGSLRTRAQLRQLLGGLLRCSPSALMRTPA
ncbi:hypothetical protein [Streptomyces sp. NPDC092129]|uniref:hypothetical protein n=1 Tax=Streptomyces sp. NPDC092129 TaxID=3366010 RepID=UPI003803A8AD